MAGDVPSSAQLRELVIRARLGDMGAFGALAEWSQSLLLGYAATRLHSSGAAEDVVQDALVAAYRQLPSLRRPESFLPWMKRIVANCCIKANDAGARQVPLEGKAIASPARLEPHAIADRQAQLRAVRAAVSALPAHQREVVSLYYLDGIRQVEVAAFLDLPLTTIKKRLHDARVRLKRALAGEEWMETEKLLREQFRHVMSAGLVDRLVRAPSMIELRGEERDLTVLFSDANDMTQVFSDLSPRDAIAFLNEYFEAMADVILDHDGLVDKLIGDEIMALWGAPVASDDHAVASCRAALAMQQALRRLNERRRGAPFPAIASRTGISSGPGVIGNMGYRNRLTYTPMGWNINLGARLVGVNRQHGTTILISSETQARVAAAFDTREVATIEVKTAEGPRSEKVYELLAAHDPHASATKVTRRRRSET